MCYHPFTVDILSYHISHVYSCACGYLCVQAKVNTFFDAALNAAERHIQSGFPETSSVHHSLCDSDLFTAGLPLFRLSL